MRTYNNLIINQNRYDLLPFAWIGEAGTTSDLGANAQIKFIVESSDSPYVDYSLVVDGNNKSITQSSDISSTVYVPQNVDAQYQHQKIFYTDVIAEDLYGIRDVRLQTTPDEYTFETVDNVFFIPKFTWDPYIVGNVASTTTTTTILPGTTTTTTTTTLLQGVSNTVSVDIENSFWVGTEQGLLQEIKFKRDSTSSSIVTDTNTSNTSIPFYVNRLLFATDTNDFYVSADNNFYIYGCNNYLTGEEIYYKDTVINNGYNLASLYLDGIWSLQTYSGKVVLYDASDFSVIKEYSGFDAPFKIVKSSYHNAYFVAGSHILWQIKGDVVTAVYEINGYNITDFDVSEQGQVSIVFTNADGSIWRVIDNNLFDILSNIKGTDNKFRFCKYCGEGKFYALSELNTLQTIYVSAQYIFDVNSKQLRRNDVSVGVVTTTTTTTLPPTANVVTVNSPNGGETWQLGEEYEVKWSSSKSVNDFVQIDLIKDGNYYCTVASKTNNTGVYKWVVSKTFDESDNYKIRITWLSGGPSVVGDVGESAVVFSIILNAPVTTTTTTPSVITEYAIGVDYDAKDDLIIFVLRSGLYGLYSVGTGQTYGLFESAVSQASCMVFKDSYISTMDYQDKVRIFVGSEENLSDKWDSGEVETSLKSMYYGGGNNLQPGKKYYVHIQTHSNKYGWSDVQTAPFIMPL